MIRTRRPPLRTWSVAGRLAFLAAAGGWAGAVVAFVYGDHRPQPSTPWLERDGHTFFTHPPALTLAQRDPVSATIVTVVMATVVGIAAVDLAVRIVRRTTRPGVVALGAGGVLVLFSLFGLLFGLLGIGPAGVLVALSGLAMRPQAPLGRIGPGDPGQGRRGADWRPMGDMSG